MAGYRRRPMTFRTLGLSAAVLFSLSISPAVRAHDGADHATASEQSMAALHGQLIPAKDAPADWLAKERENYPLDSCVVSEDAFKGSDMGGPIDFVYKQEGKPDRLVRFCCKDCIKDFKKDPNKYLGEIDAAAAKRKGASTHS